MEIRRGEDSETSPSKNSDCDADYVHETQSLSELPIGQVRLIFACE